MPNYQNGKIYKIESLIGNCVYYGSTTKKYLSDRMSHHRYESKHNAYTSSKKVLQYNDAKVYLVELYPCNSKNELNSREGWYIKHNECVNKQIPGRTKQEYFRSEKHRAYEESKERMIYKKKKQLQYQNNKYQCECGSFVPYFRMKRHNTSKRHHDFLSNPFVNFKL